MWDRIKVRNRFGGMVRFTCGATTEINYIQVFFLNRYNVKTCFYTVSAFYHD